MIRDEDRDGPGYRWAEGREGVKQIEAAGLRADRKPGAMMREWMA